ncbi:choline ABC transporter permease [Lentibacillus kapialis]|uniref:Choline ABC transporter permease n=1 Tax=Lentibacillus kapialis TaxID=340214 RepID=A0A917PVU0_9BACI|nr:ABC transporter permease [Lentibacillus kapialis]GGJ93490.1 choline ABC transporter permease [Lentibacillus kapialis]
MHEFSDYFYVFVERSSDIFEALLQHLLISVVAILLGCVVAVPLGIFLSKTSFKWIQSIVFTITNIFQTIPSLAMLAIFIPLIGIGLKPAIIALFLYSLMPILRNTYAAFESIDDGIIESARGMGYSSLQQMIQIEVPLAMPYIMSGIRLTTVYIINWATLAALIGAGGLGQLIIGGMGVNNKPLIMAAAILAMVLALTIDFLFGRVEKTFVKRESSAQNSMQMEEKA